MKIGEIFTCAARTTKENYGKAIGISLAYLLVSYILMFGATIINNFFNFIFENSIVSFIVYLIMSLFITMMGYGYIKQYIDIYYGKNVKVFDFIKNCFEKLKILVKTTLLLCLKCTIPVIILLYLARLFINFVLNVLFLLGASIGLIKIIMILIYMLIFGVCVEVLLKYMFVNNELAHSANLTAKEIMNNSVENMKGNKLRMTGYYLITFIAFAFVYFICSLIGTLGTIIMLAIYLLTFIPFIQFLFVIFYEDIRSTKMSNVSLVNNRNEEEDFELQDPIQNI